MLTNAKLSRPAIAPYLPPCRQQRSGLAQRLRWWVTLEVERVLYSALLILPRDQPLSTINVIT